MTPVVSPAVAALVAESRSWHTGRSKRTGELFFLVPSRSEPGVAHYTCCYGCTCRGFEHRGRCAHVEAVNVVVTANMTRRAS